MRRRQINAEKAKQESIMAAALVDAFKAQGIELGEHTPPKEKDTLKTERKAPLIKKKRGR